MLMKNKRGTHAADSILVALDQDSQVALLLAAAREGVLAALASSSKQLCRLARSRLRFDLMIRGPKDAVPLLEGQARGRPPFTGCRRLVMDAYDPQTCLMAVAVLNAAQQWPYLECVGLGLAPAQAQAQPSPWLDHCTSGVLSVLPALKRLRRLVLHVQEFGACSAGHLGQLQQLQQLNLTVLVSERSGSAAAGEAADAAAAAAAGAVPALPPPPPPPLPAAAPDLSALSRMTNLVELVLTNAPPVRPAAAAAAAAAGAGGPYSLPSSLTRFEASLPIDWDGGVSQIACWLTHLPGCPQLQELVLQYGHQHASAHPAAVVRLVGQHHPQLRELLLCTHEPVVNSNWLTHVEGLPDAPVPEGDGVWHPDAALASLRQLEHLACGRDLYVMSAAHWQHLARMPALTRLQRVDLGWPLAEEPATNLTLLVLDSCRVYLDGHDLGRLLLACRALEQAYLDMSLEQHAPPADAAPLGAHPVLKVVEVTMCDHTWVDAVAHFAALAPVLARVQELSLEGWWTFSNRNVLNSQADSTLPDLSPCTALTRLVFGCYKHTYPRAPVPQEQEDFLSMVAPLVQLQRLEFQHAARLNARVAPLLQHMLPQLQLVRLVGCGTLLPSVAGSATADGAEQQQQREEQALAKVQRLLRPGLEVVVVESD